MNFADNSQKKYPNWIEDTVREKEFMNIIKDKSIKTFFQPIISLRIGKILGYEALSRISKENPFENIEDFIMYAMMTDRLFEAEDIMLNTALKAISENKINPYSKLLFLNVDPNVL